MRRLIDLHCHYIPGVDDGVRTVEESVRLLSGLAGLGYETVVATPHIRTAMFENRRPGLLEAFETLRGHLSNVPALPETGIASEHFFDDVFWELFMRGEAMPYPGGHAALVELPSETFPRRLADRFFEMNVRGIRPVLAHPERYRPLFRRTDPLDELLDVGALPLLDVMSLADHYGRQPRRAAERMLEEGVYYAACTDCHRPGDVEVVGQAIERLRRLVGDDEARELLSDNPGHILSGTVES